MYSFANVLLVAGLASQVGAKTIKVEVGNGGLTFKPKTIQAAVNDDLEFHFYPMNHSVVVGDFKTGCVPAVSGTMGAFYSGYVPTSSGKSPKVFSVKVSSTSPVAIYCSQGNHCKSGMYAVINPSGGETLQAYGALAKASTSVSVPAAAFGGILGSSSSSDRNGTSPSSTETGSPSETSDSASGGGSGTSTTSGSVSPTISKPAAAGMVRADLGGLLAAFVVAMFMT